MLMVLLRHVIQTKLVSIIRCRLLRSAEYYMYASKQNTCGYNIIAYI